MLSGALSHRRQCGVVSVGCFQTPKVRRQTSKSEVVVRRKGLVWHLEVQLEELPESFSLGLIPEHSFQRIVSCYLPSVALDKAS